MIPGLLAGLFAFALIDFVWLPVPMMLYAMCYLLFRACAGAGGREAMASFLEDDGGEFYAFGAMMYLFGSRISLTATFIRAVD